MSPSSERTQGIREHAGQFSLHVLLVFVTGLTIGSERAVVPVPGRVVLGVESLLVSVFLIKETVQFAAVEVDDDDHHDADLPFVAVVTRATYGDRTLFAAAQAGHVEKFVDTLFWLTVPLYPDFGTHEPPAPGQEQPSHATPQDLRHGTLHTRYGTPPPRHAHRTHPTNATERTQTFVHSGSVSW